MVIHQKPNQIISHQELTQHHSPSSCWVIIHQQVYDLTSFLDRHPGGPEVILRYAGSDASEAFDTVHALSILDTLPATCSLGRSEPAPPPALDNKLPLTTPKLPNLSHIINLTDLESAAEVGLKPKAWAYYKSAADRELSAHRNQSDWDLIRLRPRVLRNVSRPKIETETKICGFSSKMPVFIAPAALGRLAHPDGEKLLVRAAARHGIIYMVSSNASYSPEEIAQCREPGQVLFYQRQDIFDQDMIQIPIHVKLIQTMIIFHTMIHMNTKLYVNKDRTKSEQLLNRVKSLGYQALVLTVDAPVPGKRTRDERLSKMMAVPEAGGEGHSSPPNQSVTTALSGYIDASLNWDDLGWLRSKTSLPIILKGIQCAEDFMQAYRLGFRHLYLSNHGGRQVEAGSSIEILLEVRLNCPEMMEECEIYLDGGVRGGTECLKALALGARAVGIGRPAMYGLMWGEDGVGRVLDILKDEIDINLRLLGATSIKGLNSSHVNASRLEHWSYKVPMLNPSKVHGGQIRQSKL